MFFESMHLLDNVRLNFNEQGLVIMNITIAFIMFGVALDMKFESFKKLILHPKPLIAGSISQIFLLPAVTFLLVIILKPTQSVALGMILVASCPGGNVSNFISSLAKGNVELSVSLTAVSALTAIIFTPLNFAFWGNLYAKTSPLLKPIEIDALQMFQTVFILLGIPLILGIFFSKKFPNITKKIFNPIKYASILIFFGFIVGAFSANYDNFLKSVSIIFVIVFIHNGIAFATGYIFPRILKLSIKNCRTISIETGIQNSGLALALIFNPKIFPTDLKLGGMAFIAAWWGIWHIVAGLSLAGFWNLKNKRNNVEV